MRVSSSTCRISTTPAAPASGCSAPSCSSWSARACHALPERIDVGTMVEVPALLYQLDELLKKVDFVSVGSNDLFQFLFAVDRGNAKVSDRFDTMSAPILRALRDIVRKARAAK